MKRVLEVLGWLTAVALFAFASHAVFAAGVARTAPASEALTARDGAAASSPRGVSQEEAGAGRERARKARTREEVSPGSLAREARTLYVAPSEHVERRYLEYKLGKYEELRDWNLMLVADPAAADLVVTVDKTALNYIFAVTDRRTSVVVATGKCIAVNGRLAAEYLGKEIIKRMKDVRASGDGGRRRPRARDEDEDEWSES